MTPERAKRYSMSWVKVVHGRVAVMTRQLKRAKRYSMSWVKVVHGRVAVMTRQLKRAKARNAATHDRENKRGACRMFGISGKRYRALERKDRRERAS